MESTIVMRSVSIKNVMKNNPRHNENAVEKWQNQLKSSVFSANSKLIRMTGL